MQCLTASCFSRYIAIPTVHCTGSKHEVHNKILVIVVMWCLCMYNNVLFITDKAPMDFVAVYHANGTLYLSWNQQSPTAVVFCSFRQGLHSAVVFVDEVNSCGTQVIVPNFSYHTSTNLSCSVSARFKDGIGQSSTVRIINGSCKSKEKLKTSFCGLVIVMTNLSSCSSSLSEWFGTCPPLKHISPGLLATATGAPWADHSLCCVVELSFH